MTREAPLLICACVCVFFFPPVSGLGDLGFELSRSHTIRHAQPVGLPWTSDRPVAETSKWQHTTLTKDRYPCPGGIRTHNPSKLATTHPRLRQHGYQERHFLSNGSYTQNSRGHHVIVLHKAESQQRSQRSLCYCA